MMNFPTPAPSRGEKKPEAKAEETCLRGCAVWLFPSALKKGSHSWKAAGRGLSLISYLKYILHGAGHLATPPAQRRPLTRWPPPWRAP